MKIVISKSLLAAQKFTIASIAAQFDHIIDVTTLADIEPMATKHLAIAVDHDDVTINISDASMIRAMTLYVNVAKLVAPIVKACMAVSEKLVTEFEAYAEWYAKE